MRKKKKDFLADNILYYTHRLHCLGLAMHERIELSIMRRKMGDSPYPMESGCFLSGGVKGNPET